MDYLGKKYEAPLPTTLAISPVRLNLAGRILEIKDLNPRVYREYFGLLDEETLREDQGEKDAFFRGINLSFGAFASDWDFKREIYSSDAYGKPR